MREIITYDRQVHEIEKPQDKCAVVGVYSTSRQATESAKEGLIELNHRGQESSGIAAVVKNKFLFATWNEIKVVRDYGLAEIVYEIKQESSMRRILGALIAIGHDRYSTSGSLNEMQPFSNGNIAMGHNGNLTNVRQLRDKFNLPEKIDGASSDTRVVLAIMDKIRGSEKEKILQTLPLLEGSYCFVFATKNALYASRDPKGFKPLVIGTRDDGFVVASETAALRSMGANFLREVLAGETIEIDEKGLKTIALTGWHRGLSRCIFELLYFARPDSVVFGIPVMEFRRRQGEILARHLPNVDVIASIPRSGDGATLGVMVSELTKETAIDLVSAFYPNPYRNIAKRGPRTFILPNDRDKAATKKYSAIETSVRGKRVVVVDDSILRGSIRRVAQILRLHGAIEVHGLIASPEIMHACRYGNDFGNGDLIADRIPDIEKRKAYLGLDSLYHMSYAELLEAALGNPVENVPEAFEENGFCGACFTGKYPTPIGGEIDKTEVEKNVIYGS